MRRLSVTDNADTRLFILGIEIGLSRLSKKLRLPEHGSTICWFLSAQVSRTAPYGVAKRACRLSSAQMAHVVSVLVKAKLVSRVRNRTGDARQFSLRLSSKATVAFDELIEAARTIEER